MKLIVELDERDAKIVVDSGALSPLIDLIIEEKERAEKAKGKEKEPEKPTKTKVKKEEVKEKKPAVTIDELRRAFVERNSKANRKTLKKIIQDAGAKTLSQVPESKYEEVIEKLKEIEVA